MSSVFLNLNVLIDDWLWDSSLIIRQFVYKPAYKKLPYNQFWLYINFTDRVKKHEKDLLKQEGIPANYLVEDILELLKCVDMTKVRSQRVVKVQNSTFWTLTKDRLYHLCAMFFLRAVLLVSPTSWMVLESEHYTPKPFYSDNIGLK